jgi:hypothetical protein
MNDLRTAIAEMTDQQLREAYFRSKDQYTAEALGFIKEEIEKRKLSEENSGQIPETAKDQGEPVRLKSDDFILFDHSFSRTDLLLASAMLRENDIAFYIDNPTSTDTLPIEGEADKRYTIRVHKSFEEKTHALLDEHFVKADNKYMLKYTGARDRLKAFNFSDIHLSEQEAAEMIEVALSAGEKKIIIALGERLLAEADDIEKAQDRVLFYYDSIEPLIARLEEAGEQTLSRSDLLAMLEILQVYADDPALPASMDETIAPLLDLFLGG